jgi:DNA-binding transcriptional LysR family regulator
MAPKKLIDTVTAGGAADALQINLRHLQAFSAVAATGSVTQAAESLFRVASAVTRAVAELEASLGVSLFERKARGMLMNVYGEAVRARAQRVEQAFAAACQELANGDAAGSHAPLEARGLLASMFSGRRLALFASLSELHNMPAVAAAFGVTQPALSALVRELEARTGRVLFTRTARGVTPTRAGSQLAFRCKRALAELRSIGSDLAALRGAVEGSSSARCARPKTRKTWCRPRCSKTAFRSSCGPGIRWQSSRASGDRRCSARSGCCRARARRRANCWSARFARPGTRRPCRRWKPATSRCCAGCCCAAIW